MGVKGSWSRVQDQKTFGDTLDAIQEAEKKRRARMARALEVTGGKVKNGKGTK